MTASLALSVLPFVGMIFSIAVLPLVAPHFWERRFPLVALFWALCYLVPTVLHHGIGAGATLLVHVAADEYIPFIVLVASLYVASSGLVLEGRLAGTPLRSTGLLLLGTLLASWIGTTGAAMVLVRPLLRGIAARKHRAHTVFFFILLVANAGGALTPVGDPPLFMGYLQGVPFFWTLRHAGPLALVAGCLLAFHFLTDFVLFRREGRPLPPTQDLRVRGGVHLAWIAAIVVTVAGSGALAFLGSWVPWVRDALLVLFAWGAWNTSSQELRRENDFRWHPIVEVAVLFAGIFVTLSPLVEMLREGVDGPLGGLVRLAGSPLSAYFVTGALSSVLDNAPTYLVFFHAAGGHEALPHLLSEGLQLEAIGLGAVFFGAVTYIGNAPNLLVRSIAEEEGVPMPGFFAYLGWTILVLLPVLALAGWIFLS